MGHLQGSHFQTLKDLFEICNLFSLAEKASIIVQMSADMELCLSEVINIETTIFPTLKVYVGYSVICTISASVLFVLMLVVC